MKTSFSLLILLLASCTQSTKMISFTSSPSGASIAVNGRLLEGKTPLSAEVNQQKDLSIVANKKGYSVATKTLFTETNFWRTLLWTKYDAKSRYIEADSVHIDLEALPKLESYTPSKLPAYKPSDPPPLRSLPPM